MQTFQAFGIRAKQHGTGAGVIPDRVFPDHEAGSTR